MQRHQFLYKKDNIIDTIHPQCTKTNGATFQIRNKKRTQGHKIIIYKSEKCWTLSLIFQSRKASANKQAKYASSYNFQGRGKNQI